MESLHSVDIGHWWISQTLHHGYTNMLNQQFLRLNVDISG